jgi:cytochrome b
MQKIYIWDFPTRLFHWLLVLAIAAQYITAELLDDAIQWHFYGGYFILGLLIFRLLWGIWGAHYARFSQFVVSPGKTIHYIKHFNNDNYKPVLGHNPLGAYSVLFILSILMTQAISGLFISDDIFHQGPYYNAVGETSQEIMNWIHHNVFNAVWLFLVLHLGAIFTYRLLKQQNLVLSMFTGYKKHKVDKAILPAKNHKVRFLVCVLLASLLVYLIVVVFAPEVVDDFYF